MSKHKLIVRSDKQVAELYEDDKLIGVYSVSTAKNGLGCKKESYCTPHGRLRVYKKIGYDLPEGAVLKNRVPTGDVWSRDTFNPLSNSDDDLVLTRILWLEGCESENAGTADRYIYLHGTNQEHLLGSPASHGCIRFRNNDIVRLFDILQEGDEVEVS